MLKAGKSCKVFAREAGGSFNPPHELIFDGEADWGSGNTIVTSLSNKDGDVS